METELRRGGDGGPRSDWRAGLAAAGRVVLAGLVAGAMLLILAQVLSRLGVRVGTWSLRGEGALFVPVFGLPALLLTGWLALALRLWTPHNKRRRATALGLAVGGLVLPVALMAGCTGGTAAVRTWVAPTERFGHTATRLPDGTVLVAGGEVPDGPLMVAESIVASAEVFDPATGRRRRTGGLGTPRSRHTATLLPSGKVLVVGGGYGAYTTAASPRAELYDPATGKWAATGAPSGQYPGGRTALLPNGKVLLVGIGLGATAEVYDPANGTWAPTAGMTQVRVVGTATRLADGSVLVIGRRAPEGLAAGTRSPRDPRLYEASPAAEVYDPVAGTWSGTADPPTGRTGHTATLLPNGKVLVVGGWTPQSGSLAGADLYDPATGMWSATGAMVSVRIGHTATLLASGRVLVAGGDSVVAGVPGGRRLDSAEEYDPAMGTWSPAGRLRRTRSGHSATLLADGRVLVTGGRRGAGAISWAELYDPAARTWSITGRGRLNQMQSANSTFAAG